MPDDNPVLLVPEGRGPEPEGSLLPVNEAFLLQLPEQLPHAVVPVQLTFAEVSVENAAEDPQILLDPFEDGARGKLGETRDEVLRLFPDVAVPVPLAQLRSQLPDVLPPVAALGKLHRFPQEFPVAQQHRLPQVVHLVPGVVDVILPEHLEADRIEDVRHDIAHDRPAGMADMKRPGGIGADILDLDPPSLPQIGRSVSLPLPVDIAEQAGKSCLPDKEIQKAGTGNLHLFHQAIPILDPLRQDPRDFTRILFRLLGQDHRDVGGVIAVAGIFRQLHLDAGGNRRCNDLLFDACLNRFFEKPDQCLFHEEPCLYMKKVGRKANPLPDEALNISRRRTIAAFPAGPPISRRLAPAFYTLSDAALSEAGSERTICPGTPLPPHRCPCP